MTFQQKLDAVVAKNNSLVCVGLDSDYSKLPESVKKEAYPQFAFNKAIIDATNQLVCAYKLNSAFYEDRGDHGIAELKMTSDYIRTSYPQIVILIDAKRGDISSTNVASARFVFDYLGADAITVQPYLGKQPLTAFLERKDKGTFVLCRTSNPGAGEIQDLKINGYPLYLYVAKKIVKEWNTNGNCFIVAGATYPKELGEIRKIVGDMWALVPGVGKQEGEIADTLRLGLNSKKSGLIVNASRSIIFASKSTHFAQIARKETENLRNSINSYRT